MDRHCPDWQLPEGVTRGMWEYAHSDHIAEDYDDYFSENRMFTFDEQVLARIFPRATSEQREIVADLGCGTGRALVPLARRGYRGLAVDLSERMLEQVSEKVADECLPIQPICANLVELDCIADNAVHHAISMFSTFGMIRGREPRARAFAHTFRILKPGGLFVIHAHNFWFNLYDPGGPWWVIDNLLRSFVSRKIEAGDKFFRYRGVPNMFLHVFRLAELKRELRRAGFKIKEIVSLDVQRKKPLTRPWLCNALRANGWIIVGHKADATARASLP